MSLEFEELAASATEDELAAEKAVAKTTNVRAFTRRAAERDTFPEHLPRERGVLDPSRIAAQIVSGIGFIGGGVIFVRKDLVRGLTTAATVWLTSAVGMACGAGLPVLAIAVTAGHFVVVFVFPIVERRLPKSRWAPIPLRLSYWDGRGILREVLAICYGDPITIPGSEPIATAIAEAVRWATELHKKNRIKAMLVVSRGSAGVFMQTFDDESELRSQ